VKRVEELIYIVPERRQAYLEKCLNPSQEALTFLWSHGVRNQYYFQLREYILMTFEYVGHDFKRDMDAVTAHMEAEGYLVKARRKDIPPSQRFSVDWWAPVKRLGSILTEDPTPEVPFDQQYREMQSGRMMEETVSADTTYSEDDWSESVHL
jgi:L-rhamnose mutarotase